MTRDEILKMEAGIDMDILIVTRVFGYLRLPPPAMPTFQKPTPEGVMVIHQLPRYSTDIACAWIVVDKLKDKYTPCIMFEDGQWECLLMAEYACARDITAPLAICRAALLAVTES